MTAIICDSSARMTPRARPPGREVVRGREAEQKLVRELLRRAQRGTGGVLLVDGEPGIGKSLLLRDSTDQAAERGFSLAAGAADQLGQAIPFFALRAALHEPSGGDPDRDRPDATAWRITQIRAHLEQRAATAPVLVCLDDLHWASPAAMAVLRTLPRDLKRHPVAWLLARSSTPQRAADYLFGQLEQDGAARITLAPLDQDAVAAMLTDAFGAPPGHTLADLARGAAGNPSLVAELIGGLRDDHGVQVTGGRAVLASARLPQRIHRLAQRRLDGLSPRTRHLLVTAAVLGPSFRLADAAEMLGESPAMLLPAVEEAMDAAIMTAAEYAFAFRHQLLRRAVGEMIPRPARDALHRQYGEILLTRGESAARAARHQLQAAHPGDPASLAGLDRAAAQTLRSAPRTAAGLALRDERAGPAASAILADPGQHDSHATAAARLTRACIGWDSGQISDGLELLREAVRHGTGIGPDARQVQPLLALAAALTDLRQLDEADVILRAADHPALHGIPAQAGLFILRARVHLACGRLPDAAAEGRAALAIAEALDAHGYATTAHCVLSVIALRRGDLAAAAQHLACRPASGPQFSDVYARPETTVAQAQVTEARDGPAAALGQLRPLCAELPARPGLLLGDPALAPWMVRTALGAGAGELAAAIARTARALADAHPGFPALAAAAAHSQALVGREPVRLAEAVAWHPDPWGRACAAEDLGVLHGRHGDRDQAIHHLKEALGGYRQAGAERDQARIRRRLRRLGIRRRHWSTPAARPVTGWDSLTGTEQAVAGLVAEGLNNNQVAARMYISTHTVAHHLRQAFRKLSIASRVELTRIVIEQRS